MSWLGTLRHLVRPDDERRAIERERGMLDQEAQRGQELQNAQATVYSSSDRRAVELGRVVGSKRPVRLPVDRLAGHVCMYGPSGAGKTYAEALLVRALLVAGVRRMVVLDPKGGETVELCKRVIVDVASRLPPAEADDLLRRVVCLNPFSSTILPRLQLLALGPGEDAELHSYAVAQMITKDADAAVGVVQEDVLHRSIETLTRANLPLTVLPHVLREPAILDALAERCAPAELFRSTASRLRSESKERLGGIAARASRLLRLRSTRLALGAPDCLDFGRLLDENITLVNLDPPEGSVDVGRFLAGLLWVRLTQAIRRRPVGSPPAIVVLEEAPALLSAGTSQTADSTEDVLRLARARGVFLHLLAQDVVSLGKVSATLPQVLRTNAHLHVFFRNTDSEWSVALPVTGQRPRPSPPPWDQPRSGTYYLDRGAELALLRQEMALLPDRTAYLWDARSGQPATLFATADLRLCASPAALRNLEERTALHPAVASVEVLEAAARGVKERIAGLVGHRTEPTSTPAVGRGKRTRPVDIG